MKTSKEWWDEVKNDQVLFLEWLNKQYVGEVTAAERVSELAHRCRCATGGLTKASFVLEKIAHDEAQHAKWIGELILMKGQPLPYVSRKVAESRYWAEQKLGSADLIQTFAIAAHAELMRLERIRAIVEDEWSNVVVRSVFRSILKDEEFHAKAFQRLTTPEAMEATRGDHERGRAVLGLVA